MYLIPYEKMINSVDYCGPENIIFGSIFLGRFWISPTWVWVFVIANAIAMLAQKEGEWEGS